MEDVFASIGSIGVYLLKYNPVSAWNAKSPSFVFLACSS